MTKAWFVGPKRSYTLTEEDKLWLARAIAGETGENVKNLDGPAAVAWSMMNRFLLVKGQEAWPTYANLLRNYCQPINPKYARGGPKCPNSSPDKGDPCYEGLLQRRERITNMPWERISPDIRNFVESFAAGNVTLPDAVLAQPYWRLTDFAAFHKDAYVDREIGFGDHGLVTDKKNKANWFFEIKGIYDCEVHVVRSDTAPAPECFPVSKSIGGGWTTMNTLGVVLALGAAGIAAYLAWARTHS